MQHSLHLKLGSKAGVLGGGQLARMLALSGFARGLEVHILSEKATDPAAQVSHFWTKGSPAEKSDLLPFLKQLDHLTFESEFFPAGQLEKSLPAKHPYIFPSLRCMALIQDRAKQKELLEEHRIPTSPFVVLHSPHELQAALKIFEGLVLKKRIGGYDGNGTWILASRNKFEQANKIDPDLFLSPGLIAEKFIPFRRELAVMLVRSRSGEKLALPLVQSVQVDSRCDTVVGPIDHPQFLPLQKKLFKMLDAIDYVGVLGLELFDTGKELLVNELAPRVHNSGHYSQNSLSFSQFDLHWMAGLGLALPKIKMQTPAFAMINLIGQKTTTKMTCPESLQGQLHWYGKLESRPGRKMGHINYGGNSIPSLLRVAKSERSQFKL